MSETTIRQQIITALDARLKAITTENGYETDAGENVYEWRDAPFSDRDAVSLAYRDIGNVTVRAVGVHEHTLNVEAVLISPSATTPSLIRKMIADLVKSIGADTTWGGLAQDTTPVRDEEIEIVHAERKIGAVSLKFGIEYITAPWDPYTAA